MGNVELRRTGKLETKGGAYSHDEIRAREWVGGGRVVAGDVVMGDGKWQSGGNVGNGGREKDNKGTPGRGGKARERASIWTDVVTWWVAGLAGCEAVSCMLNACRHIWESVSVSMDVSVKCGLES